MAELLFEVISRSYERTSLIVTTNLPFEQWVEVMGPERMTGALLDRLTHRVHIIEANGESYRLAESRKRMNQRKTGIKKVDKGVIDTCQGAGYLRAWMLRFSVATRRTFRPPFA